MKPETIVIIVQETIWQSVVKDLLTFVVVLSLIGIGMLVDSKALQWIGAIMAMVFILGAANTTGSRMSIEEARAKLDQIEKGK